MFEKGIAIDAVSNLVALRVLRMSQVFERSLLVHPRTLPHEYAVCPLVRETVWQDFVALRHVCAGRDCVDAARREDACDIPA